MPSLTSNLYAFGEFCVDPQNRVLRLRHEPIALTPKAFEVLLLLIQRGGQVVSKDELMKAVWPDSFVEESNLTQTVFMLRKALGETANQRYIFTVQGRGYRFAAEVKTVAGNGHGDAYREAATWQSPEEAVRREGDSTNQLFEPASLPRRTGVDAPSPAKRNSKRVALAFGALVLVATGLVLWLVPSLTRRANASGPIRSIAVLPLDNFSGDP